MTYELIDIVNPSVVIGTSDNIADLWPELDRQHPMTLTGMVIVKAGEIVAGYSGLLDTMVKHKAYTVEAVRKALRIV